MSTGVDADAYDYLCRRGILYNFTVGVTATLLLAANNQRRALAVSCPAASALGGGSSITPVSVQALGSTQSATGFTCVYTCPAGKSAQGVSMLFVQVSGSVGAIRPAYQHGANVTTWTALTANVLVAEPFAINAGDKFGINQTTPGGVNVTDYYVNVLEYGGGGGGASGNQVYLGFGQPPTTTTGLPIYGGMNPQVLDGTNFGTLVQLDIWAIALAAGTPLNILVGYDSCGPCP